jgi:quercetin dioxygenase-like cupin family protein
MLRCVLLLLPVILFAQTSPEVEITAEPHHHLVFENQSVRVFKVEVAPHSDTLMHWHRHDYLFIALGAADLSNEVQGKAPASLRLQDGETRFAAASFAHLARNLSDQPFRNVTIELLEDEKLRQEPPHWDPKKQEDRGLAILQGGTQEILFIKDNVRVSEFELQPGGVIPMHHHNGPHLLVAVTDLDLRSNVQAQPPTPAHFKSGEVKWVPGGFSHTVTNIGHHPAKLVTLEFP